MQQTIFFQRMERAEQCRSNIVQYFVYNVAVLICIPWPYPIPRLTWPKNPNTSIKTLCCHRNPCHSSSATNDPKIPLCLCCQACRAAAQPGWFLVLLRSCNPNLHYLLNRLSHSNTTIKAGHTDGSRIENTLRKYIVDWTKADYRRTWLWNGLCQL